MPEPLRNAIDHFELNLEDAGDGVSPSLMFVEGTQVWYLDEDLTVLDDDTQDRDLAIMDALLLLATNKVMAEKQRRRREGIANARSPLPSVG